MARIDYWDSRGTESKYWSNDNSTSTSGSTDYHWYSINGTSSTYRVIVRVHRMLTPKPANWSEEDVFDYIRLVNDKTKTGITVEMYIRGDVVITDPDIEVLEMNAIIPSTNDELEGTNPLIIYLGYYVPWSSTVNRGIAMRYGFSDLAHEWIREGYIENYEQIDSVAYIIHLWMKYPKFGFQRTSDIASRRVREELLSLPEAKKLINEYDHIIDQRALEDYCSTLGYSKKEFWDIVDQFWNPDLFEKVDGIWRKKKDVFSENTGG